MTKLAYFRKALNKVTTNLGQQRYSFLRELQELQYSDHAVIKEIQEKKLANILSACSKIPYYSRCLQEIDVSSDDLGATDPIKLLRRLPVLSKACLAKNFDDLCLPAHELRGSSINFTGGSTGEPTRVLQDRHYKEWSQAYKNLAYGWRGYESFDSVFYIWGAARDMNQGVRASLTNFVRNRHYFNCFSLTEEKIERCIAQLNSQNPALVVAYADAIYEIAKCANEHAIDVKPLVAVHTGAGNLYEFMRREIAECFQCSVYNHYGARDAGSLASECREQNGLHLMELHQYVEILDDDNAPVPDGCEGKIVVTTLDNFSMPLIRYEIGDRGVKQPYKPCSCGRNFSKLQTVSGRSQDRVVTYNGEYINSNFFVHTIGVELNKGGEIKKFQIIQNNIDEIEVCLILNSYNRESEIVSMVSAALQERLGSSLRVVIKLVENIPKTTTGKYRYVVNNLINTTLENGGISSGVVDKFKD